MSKQPVNCFQRPGRTFLPWCLGLSDHEHSPLVANWAGGIRKQFANLSMATPFPGSSSRRLTSCLFEGQCSPRRCLFGKACTCCPRLPLHLVPSCAPMSAGLLCLIECWWSHIMNCPFPSQTSDCCFISGWALIPCRLSKAGLQGQACQDIYVAAHDAPVGSWVMSVTAA